MIEVNNLVKWYGAHPAVDDLSFTVENGCIFGLLGPNGAGKSTTMNILTGYLAPDGGSVTVEGHDALGEPAAARRCIGYLPEQPPLYGEMTVGEYLRFCAELKKLPKVRRESQVAEAVSMTRLDEQTGRLIRNLSKGYRQRVGLAQAVLGLPEVIILDEPTVGLDPKQVVEIRELIAQLAGRHTVILSSHILSEIRAVCSHVLILRKGRAVACDTPAHLESLLGGGALTATVRGESETAARIAASLPGVTVQTVRPAEDGAVSLTLSGEEDVRERLFYALAEARCPILELRPHRATLEEVFLDLTDEDDAVAAGAAALLGGTPPPAEPDGREGEAQ